VRRRKPPHPDAARPPSPARGEGCAELGADASPKSKLVSIGARSRRVAEATAGTAEPSPLAGEGGGRRSRSPGEGGASARQVGKAASAADGSNRPRDTARRLRKDMTEAERRLWSLLRNRKLTRLKFRRQVPVGPYVADFLSFQARLIVEADGGHHADSPHDATRDTWFRHQGFTVIRYWNSDILTNPDAILATLLERARAYQETAP
jgi:very-short-patch-repair endonuclease